MDIYKGLDYHTSEINRNFRIKVSGEFNGIKINKLVGVSGLILIIGIKFVNQFVDKAFGSMDDAAYFRLRRGLKITLYFK